MQTYNLALALQNGIRCIRYNWTFSDMTAAATTQSFNGLLIPYGGILLFVRIKADVAIALPYPRHYTIKTGPEFSALKARLTEEIRAEAVLAAEAH